MPSYLLDDQKLINKFDSHNCLASIEKLDDQCQQAWNEAIKIKLPPSYRKVKNIVVAGMGGAALGAHLIKTIFSDKLRLPFEIVNHYNLPAYVGPETLIFLISFSGATEEVISAADQAKKLKAKLIVIASGGRLAKLAAENNWPAYIFDPIHNPSGQPRLGLGYTLMSQLAFLKKLAFLKVSFPSHLNPPQLKDKERTESKNMALNLQNKALFIVGAEHLLGNAHILSNQINENAKQFASWFALPEIDHHLLEGLAFPKNNKQNLKFIFLESDLYHPSVQKRFPLTREVLKKQGIESMVWQARSKTKFEQSLEALSFGGFLSFYLTMLNQIDPSEIPWVNYFKKNLK